MKNTHITINFTKNGYEVCKITASGLKLLDIESTLEKAQAKLFAYEIAGV